MAFQAHFLSPSLSWWNVEGSSLSNSCSFSSLLQSWLLVLTYHDIVCYLFSSYVLASLAWSHKTGEICIQACSTLKTKVTRSHLDHLFKAQCVATGSFSLSQLSLCLCLLLSSTSISTLGPLSQVDRFCLVMSFLLQCLFCMGVFWHVQVYLKCEWNARLVC